MDPKELKELGMSNLDKVLQALDKGDLEEARKCAQVDGGGGEARP